MSVPTGTVSLFLILFCSAAMTQTVTQSITIENDLLGLVFRVCPYVFRQSSLV